jgi:ubiquinone/menaquinone biosynthesis C-methylase UbiE
MNTELQTEAMAALIELHRGLERQGPGDASFSRQLLQQLGPLPANLRAADLGCGSGAAALLLAEHYQCKVMAVDSCSVFIEELKLRAHQAGLAHLVTPVEADMAALDWPPACIDLLWSEGAAYNLGFERALVLWRPFLKEGGIAVISEMSWFTHEAPQPAVDFWHEAYPTMGSESENIDRARRAGYQVLSIQRLPSEAWWKNYYTPLRARMLQLEMTPAMQAVVHETETEMALFERFSDTYGYTFYILSPAAGTAFL